MSGVAGTLLVWLISILYESYYSQPLPWYWYVFVASFFIFLACYFAWRERGRTILDKDHDLLNREREIRKLHEALALQIEDDLQELTISPKSPLSPPEKLAHSQRRAHYLRLDLDRAASEDKPLLIKRLRSCKIISWSSCRLLEEARLNRIVPVREDTMRSHAETGDVFF